MLRCAYRSHSPNQAGSHTRTLVSLKPHEDHQRSSHRALVKRPKSAGRIFLWSVQSALVDPIYIPKTYLHSMRSDTLFLRRNLRNVFLKITNSHTLAQINSSDRSAGQGFAPVRVWLRSIPGDFFFVDCVLCCDCRKTASSSPPAVPQREATFKWQWFSIV